MVEGIPDVVSKPFNWPIIWKAKIMGKMFVSLI